MNKAIICDIDGTLSLRKNRDPYDFKSAGDDIINKPIKTIINLFYKDNYKIILLTGREERFRDLTIKWLNSNKVSFTNLLMRTNKDYRKDSLIKEEIYNLEIKNKYKVLFVIDDRDQMIQMWDKIGIDSLKTNNQNN